MSSDAVRVSQIPAALAAFDPAVVDRFEGVDDDAITKLARAAKRDFPEAYRAFLRWGGKRFELDLWETDPTVAPLHNVYRRGEWLPPAEYLLIATVKPNVDLDYDLYLRDADGPEPSAVRIPFAQSGRFEEVRPALVDLGAPFSAILFGKLFLQVHLNRMGATAFVGAHGLRRGLLADAHRTLGRLGFERHPLSGSCCSVYTRSDAAVLAMQQPGQPATMNLGAYHPSTLRELAGELGHELGMRRA